MLKRYCTDIRNTTVFEMSVLREACCHQLHRLREDSTFSFRPGLLNPSPASLKLAQLFRDELGLPSNVEVVSAAWAKHTPWKVSKIGDCVLMRGEVSTDHRVGFIHAHVEILGEYLSLVSDYKLDELDRTHGIAVCSIASPAAIIPTEDIYDALVWCKLSGNRVRTLIPREFL